MNQANMEKAKKAEDLFMKYLNKENIPFYRIDQNIESQSEIYKENNIRRPDFLINTKNGNYYIDVKYREDKDKLDKNRFHIDQEKIIKLYQFHKEIKQEVWIAFTDNQDDPEFYFTPITGVYDYYKKIEKLYEEKKYEKFDKVWIHIPDSLLFEQLTLDRGIFNENDIDYNEDVEYHKEIAVTFIN